ncbi:hydroxypyruvate isomerase [Collimonas sp. OK242]|jgi:hydroxypyruvate isomerase|uniref:hydroxypyruvate isomerase n=1 Tax=Collimonas sp. OK242 TaxID=1798195 RepID=UPI00089B401D|nr:hydroxypyruvate isomerase [Collimonas sp. OK242]SDX66251.1 hydroxypyruvate isomerase [Collimonas sp. OK242]
MTKLAANLTMLFTELPFLERFDAAAKAGFKGVEFLFPYAFRAEQLADKLSTNGLELVLHNLPAGNWEAGERGIACHPDRVSEFQQGVDDAIRYAKVLNVKQLNCLVGIVPAGVSAELARATVVGNLKFAADKLQAAGIRLLIEPINSFDIPGFFLTGTQQALELIKATGSSNVFVQYDIYHMQRMEGELANTIKANLSQIKHVQLADNPGRFEPGTGEINYRYLFKFLDEIGYDGWIGCEYKPQAGTVEGLGWRAAHGV